MTSHLLFKNNYNPNKITQEQRIECFGRTLNEAFEQFQKLWHDYKELLKKCQEHETAPSHIAHEVPKVTEVTIGSKNEKPISVELTNEQFIVSSPAKKTVEPESLEVHHDSNEKTLEPGGYDELQIFSQDLWTQGLEESFDNLNEPILQENENIATKRSKSPILGSKKKSRVVSRPASSPTVSENSVILLNNSIEETGEKSDDVYTPNTSLDLDAIVTQTTPARSINRPILQTLALNIPSTPKNTGKLCISTTHNVSTDVVSSKKKLKQTKLFLKKDKVTDLSDCNDIVMSQEPDRVGQTETLTANNCTDDSFIHASPIHEKNPSKIREKMSRKNKSVELLNEKLDKDTGMETDEVETSEIDTDATIFEPKLASTQHSYLFSLNKAPQVEQKLNTNKSSPGRLYNRKEEVEGVTVPDDADIEMNDDTMYEANTLPTIDHSSKNVDVRNSLKKNNLSLKKLATVPKKFQKTPKHLLNTQDEEMNATKGEASLDNCKESREKASTKKKPGGASFDTVPRKRAASPSHAYKENPVRKRDERALLKGWSCFDCQKYYDGMDLSKEELQKRKDQCSRHRSKFNKNQLTQQGYWNPDFTSSWHSTVWEDIEEP